MKPAPLALLLACADPPPAPCLGAPSAAVAGDLTLRPVAGQGVDLAALPALLGPTLADWRDRGLRLHLAPPLRAPLPFAFAPGHDPAATLAPLQALRAHLPVADGVYLVVLDRLAHPQAPLLRQTGALRGLALSPQIPADDPLRGLGLVPEDGAAIVLLEAAALRGGDPTRLGAHELGHALGLPHREAPGALMHPGPGEGCVGALNDAEAAAVCAALQSPSR